MAMAGQRTGLEEGNLCCVIGSSGCLGRELVHELLERGYRVNGFDLNDPVLDDERVHYFKGDLTCQEELLPALEGVDTVFHTASPASGNPNKALFDIVNVKGTQNIIQCCLDSGVPRLVGTSSTDVVFDGRDVHGAGEEDLVYAANASDEYDVSKVAMEKLVLAANNRDHSRDGDGKLMTAAIRCQSIYGPGDSGIIPFLKKYGGDRTLMIGSGTNKVDVVYCLNAAHCHILAAERLYEGSPVCGEVFFVSDDEPLEMKEFGDAMLSALGYKAAIVLPWLPVSVFMFVAYVMSFVQRTLAALGIYVQVPLVPNQVTQAVATRFYSCAKAKALLGYKPMVNLTEGLQRTIRHYQALRHQQQGEEKKKKL